MNSVPSSGGGVFSDMSAPCRAVVATRTGGHDHAPPSGRGPLHPLRATPESRAAWLLTGGQPQHRRTPWAGEDSMRSLRRTRMAATALVAALLLGSCADGGEGGPS